MLVLSERLESNLILFIKQYVTFNLGWNPPATRSMFFDKDEDLAHEFYEERAGKLVRVTQGLRRQGEVPLEPPTINPALSIVLQV